MTQRGTPLQSCHLPSPGACNCLKTAWETMHLPSLPGISGISPQTLRTVAPKLFPVTAKFPDHWVQALPAQTPELLTGPDWDLNAGTAPFRRKHWEETQAQDNWSLKLELVPSAFTATPIMIGNTQCFQVLCLSQTHRKKPVVTETTLTPVSCSHPKAPSSASASNPPFQSSAAKFPSLGQTW